MFGKSNVTNPFELNDKCVIHPTAYVKVLGVHVDTLLIFHDHISYICSRASRSMCALSRLSSCLTVKGKLQVMSHFNFVPLSGISVVQVTRVKWKKIQYMALKYIYNDFKTNYCDVRARCHIQLFYIQRQRAILEEVYKINHSICAAYVNELLKSVQNMYCTRKKYNIVRSLTVIVDITVGH